MTGGRIPIASTTQDPLLKSAAIYPTPHMALVRGLVIRVLLGHQMPDRLLLLLGAVLPFRLLPPFFATSPGDGPVYLAPPG